MTIVGSEDHGPCLPGEPIGERGIILVMPDGSKKRLRFRWTGEVTDRSEYVEALQKGYIQLLPQEKTNV